MKKIILASAFALVCGTPLAFAANSGMSNGVSIQHCSDLTNHYKSKAPANAASICRQDPHKNNNSLAGDHPRDHEASRR